MKANVFLMICGCAALLLNACGTDEMGAPVPVVDVKERETPPDPVAPEPGPQYTMLLESVDRGDLTANALTSFDTLVRLRDADSGEVVPEETLEFQLTHAPDDETMLVSARGLTRDDGTAAVQLRLGAQTGSAIVMVTHPEAAPLYLEIQIEEALEGSIRVKIVEPANLPIVIAPFRVSFFDAADVTCAEYLPRGRQPTSYIEINVVDSATPVTAEGFTPDIAYTIVAEAMGSGGRPLGAGCVDNVAVNRGTTTDATISIDMLPIGPSGDYLVDGVWDISEAMASANDASGMFVGVIEFMANPGAAIYDLVLTQIEDAVDFPIGVILGITGIRQQVIDYVNGQLFQFAPLETFSAVASDLNTMLNEMQVQGTLTINKTDDDYNFTGHEEWTAITVNWTWRCQNNPTPGCGQHVVDLAGADAGAASVAFDWIGHVEGYDQLVIDSHTARFDVGRLQLYLLEQAILPELTGGSANTLGEALAYWVDCADLAAQAVAGNDICDPTGLICLGETIINGACVAAMNEIGDYITAPLQNQPVLDLDLAGTARLVDAQATSFASGIEDGRTDGTVQGTMEPINATWSAVRIED